MELVYTQFSVNNQRRLVDISYDYPIALSMMVKKPLDQNQRERMKNIDF